MNPPLARSAALRPQPWYRRGSITPTCAEASSSVSDAGQGVARSPGARSHLCRIAGDDLSVGGDPLPVEGRLPISHGAGAKGLLVSSPSPRTSFARCMTRPRWWWAASRSNSSWISLGMVELEDMPAKTSVMIQVAKPCWRCGSRLGSVLAEELPRKQTLHKPRTLRVTGARPLASLLIG